MTPHDAIRGVLAECWADLHAFARRRTDSLADAEDVLQTFALKVLGRAPAVLNNPRAWLYRLLRNTIIDHQRGAAAYRRGLAALAAELPTMPVVADPTTPCQCVERALGELDPGTAEVVRRATLASEPHAAIAERTGSTAGAIAVRLHRARRRLARRVLELCGDCCPRSARACTCDAPGPKRDEGCKEPPSRSSSEVSRGGRPGPATQAGSSSPAPNERHDRSGATR